MAGRIAARLTELGIVLPEPPLAVGAYVPHLLSGATLYISGQLPVWAGERRFIGKLGAELALEQGVEAARLCALNVLAQARAALGGDLDRVRRCLKLAGFVACAPGFVDHPKVINGASDLMEQVFGAAGRHTRVAVGAASLPLDVAVELEAVFEVA